MPLAGSSCPSKTPAEPLACAAHSKGAKGAFPGHAAGCNGVLGIVSCEASVMLGTSSHKARDGGGSRRRLSVTGTSAEAAVEVAPGNGALVDFVVAGAACEVLPEGKTLVVFVDSSAGAACLCDRRFRGLLWSCDRCVNQRLVLLKLRGCFVSSVHVPLHEVNPRIFMKIRGDPFEVRRGGGGRHVKCGGGVERWQGTVTHTRQVG